MFALAATALAILILVAQGRVGPAALFRAFPTLDANVGKLLQKDRQTRGDSAQISRRAFALHQ